MKSALEIAFKPSVIIEVQIAGLVGTLLTVINQFNELFNGPYTVLLSGQILLNYLIPYLISIVYSILSFFAWQDSQRIILDQKKSFEQFPERNPNPVFRVSAHNKLIYAIQPLRSY